MKPSDVKPHMIFRNRTVAWRLFTVEAVVEGTAKGDEWGHMGPPKAGEVPLALLSDETHWTYLEKETFDSMARAVGNLKDQVSRLEKEKQKAEELRSATLAHHEPNTLALCAGDRRADLLQQRLDDFRKQSQEDYLARKADLKRVWLYVDNAASGEYGYRDAEGHLCAQLLEKWGGGNASDPPSVKVQKPVHDFDVKVEQDSKDPSLMHISANIPITWRWLGEDPLDPKRVVNSTADAIARGDLKPDSNGQLIATKDMTIGGVDEVDDRSKHTALGELTAVLWFLTTLALDHEPLCAIKQGGDAKCDCDKLIPDNDTWAKRVRAALQLPGKVQQELTELKKTVAEHAEKLKARRTLQARPIAGVSVAGGQGTAYEYPIEDKTGLLVVVKVPARGVASGQYHQWADEVHALVKKEFGPSARVVVMDSGLELTLLELP